MTTFWALLQQFGRLLIWWVTVAPWEQAIRVTCGRRVTLLSAGMHRRLPFIDEIYKQSTRLRLIDMPIQTVTTRDGQTITVGGNVGYVIRDLRALYNSLHHAEGTLRNLAAARIAEYIHGHVLEDCTPQLIQAATTDALDLDRFGLAEPRIDITDFAIVRTYRLIMDARWSVGGDALSTNQPAGHGVVP